MDDAKWFVGLLLILGLLWLGGKARVAEQNREATTSTPRVQTPTQPPSEAEQRSVTTAPAPATVDDVVAPEEVLDPNISPLRGALKIASIRRGTTADKEYITVQASGKNEGDIVLTGFRVRSAVTLISQPIGRGWSLFFPQSVGEGELIRLRPGGRALIISGRAPLILTTTGAVPLSGGFQLNLCTGYFEQGLDFNPKLPLQCPSLQSGPLPQAPNTLSDDCYDQLARIRRCTAGAAVPDHLAQDGNCQTYILKHNTYNQCVANYKSEPDFFRGEWRIYLGRTSTLWHDRHDVVELLDVNGKIIDSKSY